MNQRTSERERLRKLLRDEKGTIRKEAPQKIALCYPSSYHLGMSSLGFQTIYREINQRRGSSAERAFLPEEDATDVLTLESQSPLSHFAVAAFSIAYELELSGFFRVLQLSGIPLLREDRGTHHPLVIAGGPLTFSNPVPLEPFVDLLLLGEGEELIHFFLDAAERLPRGALLDHLSTVPGFLVPGRGGNRFGIARASDQRLPARSQIVTPHTELRSMFLIEPERGCSRGCHYCVMRRTTNGGMRTVSPAYLLSLIPEEAVRVGLVGAAVTDHPQFAMLLRTLVDSGREVGVSSLRADRLTQEIVDSLRRGGARTLTVASDGASQRMRDLVDRKHSEAQILRAASFARAAKMKQLKVYNMVGLPLEEDEDIDELVRFTRELSRIIPVALGVAPFVAKRNTPMDGSPFAGIKPIDHKLNRLRRGLQGKAEVRATSARWAWVEYMLAQCGPEAGLAAMDAYRAGGSFAAFQKAFAQRNVQPFLVRRSEDGRRKPTAWPTVEWRASSSAMLSSAPPGSV